MNSNVHLVINTLRTAGFKAFLVGGCVRDMLLGRTPKDWDVATDATPDQILPLFAKTIPVGAKFGVVAVIVGGEQFEIATFRADGAYSDGRRPDEVRFSLSARGDVSRRDFTMNGLLLDEAGEIIDHVSGMADMKDKLIRCIGSANARFEEDPLRMLRAVRFVARLGFTIETETFCAIVKNAKLINLISRERVAEEMRKLLTGNFAIHGLELLVSTGLLGRLFPKLNTNKFYHTLERFRVFKAEDSTYGLAMLLADHGKVEVEETVESLKLSRDESKTLRASTHFRSMISVEVLELGALKMLARTTGLLTLGIALFKQDLALGLQTTGQKNLDTLLSLPPAGIYPTPLLTGKDLIADLGLTPSPLFTRILLNVEYKQLNGDLTTQEEALAYVRAKFLTEVPVYV